MATLCLAPQRWSLGGVVLPVASLELVATDPRYRGRGLQAALSWKFDGLAMADGFLLAGVLGIPHYFSKFGYAYASPCDENIVPPVPQVLRAIEADPFRDRSRSLVTRPLEEADLPALTRLWAERDQALDLHYVRDQADWTNLVRHPLWEGAGHWHVVTEAGRVVGGFDLPAYGPDPSDRRRFIYYLAALERDVMLEVYRFAAATATAEGQDEVAVRVPPGGQAYATALSVGGRPVDSYGWQVKIYDRPGLMRALAPVLERRLAASVFRGLTGRLVFNLYSARLTLEWTGGRLARVTEEPIVRARPASGPGCPASPAPCEPAVPPVETPPPALEPRVWIPSGPFTQLVLGYRTVADLTREHPDVIASKAHRALLDVLFPALRAWVEY